MKRIALTLPFALLLGLGVAFGTDGKRVDKFRQLEEILPTPNVYRAGSGAPGHAYWQQRADYAIDVVLDDDERRITGSETITYHNASPDTLEYIWVQIDPNIFSPESHAVRTALSPNLDNAGFRTLERTMAYENWDGGAEITSVRDANGNEIAHTINGTMMRVDLPAPVKSKTSTTFSIDWTYLVNDSSLVGGRTGFEHFEEDGNTLYEIAQFYPRVASYNDVTGWQHKQYLGRGEFTLEFGDYHVHITVPDDHIVASTGVLENPEEVLTQTQRSRLASAEGTDEQVFIVTPEEAKANESTAPTGTKTWIFDAKNVRDFAFASSRKFIWDARHHPIEGGEAAWAMSYYPNEGEPLWSKYSTTAIVHTLDTYSKRTFPYPYPVAISVNGPVGGMEYPMICFNGPRPEKDGTYSARTKYGLISVIIHEVGHNWFPMIVNSDERQWTWMDEGLNSFMQYLSEQEWETDYPSRSGEPKNIVRYMTSTNQVPIMTNSESILQFGNNAYAKPATALNVLRETVMGRELFDFAFQKYSQRWMFKRPMPADLFRTMEDASAVDLDWFWRGWFYSTDHTDLAIDGVTQYRIDSQDPEIEASIAKAERGAEPETIAQVRNASMPKRIEANPALADFYNSFDELDITPSDRRAFENLVESLDDNELALLRLRRNFYVVDISNAGGLVMPVILEVRYTDGSTEELRIPAEIWRQNTDAVSKLVMTEKTIESIVLDPHLETADADVDNNRFPRETAMATIKLSKRPPSPKNPMQKARADSERGE